MSQRIEQEVTTTYLEMLSRDSFRPKRNNRPDVYVKQVEIPSPTLNQYFFIHVGRPWQWYSRLEWTYDDWRKWVEKNTVSTWIGYTQGTPFGYIELEMQGDSIEIAFFGLLSQFIGKGLGGYLLSEAVRIAWDMGPKRVWVHTCTLDHKYALGNYLARGFSVYKEEKKLEHIPAKDDPVWLTPRFYKTMAAELRRTHGFSDI